MTGDILNQISFVAAIILPLFNLPLIFRIIQRKSAQDISLIWLFGVWACTLLMMPAGLRSEDLIWRTFILMNVVLFTMVVIVTIKYKKFKT